VRRLWRPFVPIDSKVCGLVYAAARLVCGSTFRSPSSPLSTTYVIGRAGQRSGRELPPGPSNTRSRTGKTVQFVEKTRADSKWCIYHIY